VSSRYCRNVSLNSNVCPQKKKGAASGAQWGKYGIISETE
jgi:hypothetical protein